MKEYTYAELSDLFLRAGFASTAMMVGIKGRFRRLSDPFARSVEAAVGRLPSRLAKKLARRAPLRAGFDSVTIVGTKGPAAGSEPA